MASGELDVVGIGNLLLTSVSVISFRKRRAIFSSSSMPGIGSFSRKLPTYSRA